MRRTEPGLRMELRKKSDERNRTEKDENWEAVGVTSFGEAVVLLDPQDQPV